MSELCIYNARRFLRRWDILKVFPIDEKKVSGRKYATIHNKIFDVRVVHLQRSAFFEAMGYTKGISH